MQDLVKELTRSVLKEQQEQDSYAPDALRRGKRKVEKNKSVLQLTGYTKRKGNRWCAYLLFFFQADTCRFYKKCLNKQCRSEEEARLVIEYGKQVIEINQATADQKIESTILNLN